jgi:hypothetical protein
LWKNKTVLFVQLRIIATTKKERVHFTILLNSHLFPHINNQTKNIAMFFQKILKNSISKYT